MAKRCFSFFLSVLICALVLCGSASAVLVEQVQVCMPAIDIYLYEDGDDLSSAKAEDITATLDGEPLSVDSLTPSDEGIFYVYMLDISGSMPDGHFAAAKNAILKAYDRLRQQDSLALIAFGSDVTLLLKGGEGRDELSSALEGLKNDDNNTKFYNAMDTLIDIALEAEGMRRVAVVISDGIDDTDAGMTQAELETKLLNSGVSVSALCIDTSGGTNLENFRSFIRLSGGELYLFSAGNAEDVLDDLLDRLDGGWRLTLQAGNNLVSGSEQELSITFDDVNIELTVTPERWTPDDKKPRVTSAEYDEENDSIVVTFSEPVSGADDTGAYSISDSGKNIAVTSAEPIDDTSVRIKADGLSEVGSFTLTVTGLHDVSMEENELYKYSEIVETGYAVPSGISANDNTITETDASAEQADEQKTETGILITIGIAAVVVIGIVAVIIYLLSKKTSGNNKPKKDADKPKKTEKTEKTAAVSSKATFVFLDSDTEEKK